MFFAIKKKKDLDFKKNQYRYNIFLKYKFIILLHISHIKFYFIFQLHITIYQFIYTKAY